MTPEQYVETLQLQSHPEGGYYKENYRSEEVILHNCLPERFIGNRAFSTAIYYLLQQGDFSAFHKIKSDECWHFYAGNRLLIHVLEMTGNYYCVNLGSNIADGETFQFVVPAGAWFAAEPAPTSSFSLAGCTVSPGFDFIDFEMAHREQLLKVYPEHYKLIRRLCR